MCVVVTRYENGEMKFSSSAVRSSFASDLMNTQQKPTKNENELMESMLYQGHRFVGGIKHFWMAVSVWKTNLVLEHLSRQNGGKCDQSEGSCEV
jgi:hypothetical protein